MLVVSLGLGFVGLIAACSDHVEKADVCAGNPKAKGCKQTSDAGASSATTYGVADAGNGAAPPTPPTVSDGGKADGGGPKKPNVPPANTACVELTKCSAKVKDTVERAACAGIAINQDSGVTILRVEPIRTTRTIRAATPANAGSVGERPPRARLTFGAAPDARGSPPAWPFWRGAILR